MIQHEEFPGIFFSEPKVPGNSPIDVPMLKRSYVGGIFAMFDDTTAYIYVYIYI